MLSIKNNALGDTDDTVFSICVIESAYAFHKER